MDSPPEKIRISSQREPADIAAYRAPRRAEDSPDAGGILAMRDHAQHHLATADPATPAVLVLARSHRAVTAIKAAGSLLTSHWPPAPEHRPPIVEGADRIAAVIGNCLRRRHPIIDARPDDPMLHWVGPTPNDAEQRMLGIAEDL
ncbi:hypothetical protein [Nocardia canadensis]|uniref:hypothetical protein n=1 Tax=Nocardia canadensis TaxID=3065238 RepID=UPI00293082BA|nr:hypothetical protein [Nocardia canadensis]